MLVIIYSLTGAVSEIEATVLNPTAHYYTQRETVLLHFFTHTSETVLLDLTLHLVLLLHHVCSIAKSKDPVNLRVML